MSIALQNQVDELEKKVVRLVEQVEQLSRNLHRTTTPTEHKRRGRPPRLTQEPPAP